MAAPTASLSSSPGGPNRRQRRLPETRRRDSWDRPNGRDHDGDVWDDVPVVSVVAGGRAEAVGNAAADGEFPLPLILSLTLPFSVFFWSRVDPPPHPFYTVPRRRLLSIIVVWPPTLTHPTRPFPACQQPLCPLPTFPRPLP